MKEKPKKKKKRKQRIIIKNISNLFCFFEMNSRFLIIIFKTYFKKRNERERKVMQKTKKEERQTERRKFSEMVKTPVENSNDRPYNWWALFQVCA
jgi:hypothetical protein